MTKDELYRQYEEELARIDKEAHEAREIAKATLQEQLRVLREAAYADLKAIRKLEQKTKRSRQNAR